MSPAHLSLGATTSSPLLFAFSVNTFIYKRLQGGKGEERSWEEEATGVSWRDGRSECGRKKRQRAFLTCEGMKRQKKMMMERNVSLMRYIRKKFPAVSAFDTVVLAEMFQSATIWLIDWQTVCLTMTGPCVIHQMPISPCFPVTHSF